MKGKELRKKILEIIEEEWPISVTQIALDLGHYKKKMTEKKRKAVVGKIVYHVRKLEKQEKVRTKKIGQAVVIWPHEIEKIRVVHEMLR